MSAHRFGKTFIGSSEIEASCRGIISVLASAGHYLTHLAGMEVEREVDIEKLADLSRLDLSDEEKELFGGQVSEILGFFRQLQEVEVEGIRPMAHPFEADSPLREDLAGSAWTAERALRNAPASRLEQIIVPKVVEDA